MKDLNRIGCPKLDGPEVSHYLFYPRASLQNPVSREGVRDVMIPVEPDVSIGARYHIFDKQGASILFFHGNGEIVEDYEDIAFLYSRLNLNFLPVDYRGYGHSTGRPSVSAMLRDAHIVFDLHEEMAGPQRVHRPLRRHGTLAGKRIGARTGRETTPISLTG